MRISLRFGLCIAGLISGYLFSVVQHNLHSLETERTFERTATLTFPGARLSQDLQTEFKYLSQAFEKAVVFGDEEAIAQAAVHIDASGRILEAIDGLPGLEPARRTQVQDLTADLRAYGEAALPVYASMAAGALQMEQVLERAATLNRTRFRLQGRIQELLDAFTADLRQTIDASVEATVRQRAVSVTTFLLIVAATLTVVAVALSRWMRRLRSVMTASERMAAGDYAVAVAAEGTDELAQLATSFNRMREAVEHRDRDLRAFSEGLEQLVGERTRELEARTSAYQEQLRETEKAHSRILLLDTAFAQVPDAVGIVADEDRELDYANPAMQRLMLPPEPNSGDEDQPIVRFIRTAPLDRPVVKDLVLSLPGGKIHLEAHSTPLVDGEGVRSSLILLIRDVTEAKLIQAQMNQSQRLESIGQLAAGVAHEINTPIQFVGDNLRFLEDSFRDLLPLIETQQQVCASSPPDDPTLRARLEEVTQQADYEFRKQEIPDAITQSLEGIDRVATIVRSLKEFAHPESDAFTAADLKGAITSTLNVSRNEYKYVADLVTDFDESLPPVTCLIGKINQVVLNMVVNASHAIEASVKASGGRGTITVSTRRAGEWAEIRIKDTGCGMAEEVKRRAFEPFFTTKEVGKGTGQGLYLAHDVIVNKHGGTIDIETAVGAGTTFILRIPIAQTMGSGSHIVV